MFRGWACALGLACLAAGGCKQEASLNVTWDFQGTTPASSGCGQHGVDSILLTGIDSNGGALRQVVLCTPGQTTASLDAGNWSVALAMLDFQGTPMEPSPDAYGNAPPDPTGMAQVTNEVPGAVLIHLTPVPACRDQVDNDGDGRVDLDDPDCQNDPDGVAE